MSVSCLISSTIPATCDCALKAQGRLKVFGSMFSFKSQRNVQSVLGAAIAPPKAVNCRTSTPKPSICEINSPADSLDRILFFYFICNLHLKLSERNPGQQANPGDLLTEPSTRPHRLHQSHTSETNCGVCGTRHILSIHCTRQFANIKTLPSNFLSKMAPPFPHLPHWAGDFYTKSN
jgi:hypothetical protein